MRNQTPSGSTGKTKPAEGTDIQARKRKVTCTECGRCFSPRGLSGHMRLKHGLRQEPQAALPAEPGLPAAPDVLQDVMSALARIETKLSELEQGLAARPADPHPALAAELRSVLVHIDHFRRDPEGEDAIAKAARFRRLGLLRRRQAELLYELSPSGELNPDELLGT